jgi:hypothetical protein
MAQWGDASGGAFDDPSVAPSELYCIQSAKWLCFNLNLSR